MHYTVKSVLGAAALASISIGAMAQAPVTQKSYCVHIGINPMEPIGDRPNHSLNVLNYSCRIEGGPMDGGILTGTNITEWDSGKAVVLSGSGVGRKPGALASFEVTAGSAALLMSDGKVTGMASSGKGVMKHASGSASSLNGKTYSYVVRTLTHTQFVIETTYD